MDSLSYDYKTDPLYAESQSTLMPFYSSLLKGNINDYYKPIGEVGGQEFENMLSMMTRDTTKGVNENLNKSGMLRGGLSGAALAPALANTSGTLRYNDFLRAMTGRQGFLNTVTSGLEGVRSSAMSNQQDMNRIGYDVAKTNYSTEQANKQAEDAMWAQILGSTMGMAGTVAGAYMTGGASLAAPKMGSAAGTFQKGSQTGMAWDDFLKYTGSYRG